MMFLFKWFILIKAPYSKGYHKYGGILNIVQILGKEGAKEG